MSAEQKTRLLGTQSERRILSGISDPRRAVVALGLNDVVIQKFSDKLTLEGLLAEVRKGILGPIYTSQTPPEQDHPDTQAWVREEAGHSLRLAGVGRESWMHHSDPAVRRFGRRMYIELNPDDYSPEQLAKLKKEWKI